MRSRLNGALAALFVAASSLITIAQETSSEKAKGTSAEVRFWDGSLVRMTIVQEHVEVMTVYGKLTIPLKDILRIELGLHMPEGLEAKIDQSISLLSSPSFHERDKATKMLTGAGHWAYPTIKKALQKEKDLEVTSRLTGILKRVKDTARPELLSLKEQDVIQTKELPIVIGRLLAPTIKARSAHFGELALKLSDIRAVYGRAGGSEKSLTIDAAKHGSAPDQWLNTEMTVDNTLRLIITAEGQVDLWPQGPGQYLSQPKGYTTAGKSSTFMAGAIVGRIGESGKVFLIGDRYDGTSSEEGRLFVQIVPSPWNNASTGSYQVRIKTDLAALSGK